MSVDIADLAIRIDTQELRLAQLELDRLRGSAGNAERAAGSLGVALRSALGPVALIAAAVQLGVAMVKTAEQIQNMDVRLKGLTKSAQDYAQVQKYLSDLAQKHHKDNLVLADSFSRLLTLEQAGLVTRKQSIALLEGMSNAASKTGASVEQLKQSMFGFAQGMASGVVHMEELNQVTEPIPGLLNKMAEASGYSAGELRKLVADGRITSDVFGKIMVEAFSSYQGAAEAAGDTLTAKYGDIRNAWIELVRVVEEPVADVMTPLLEGLTAVVRGLTKDFRELKQLKDNLFGGGDDWTGSTNLGWQGSSGTIKKDDPGKAATVAAIHAEIEATEGLRKAKRTAASESEKAAKRAIDDARRKAEAIADGIRAEFDALDDQHNKLTLSERDYYASTLALKQMSFAQKAMALAVWDSNKALQDQSDKQSTAERELTTLTDRYNQLTLSAREYYQTKLQGEGLSTEQQVPILAQFDKNAATEANKQAIDDSKASLDAYISSIDTANDSVSKLGATSSAVFDSALGGIHAMVGAFGNMADEIEKNTAKLVENRKQQQSPEALKDLGKKKILIKEEMALNDANFKASLTGVRQIAGATASMFAENSSARKTFHALEMALGAIEIAMEIKGLASKAAAAILTQGKGDPYTAFFRIAAMTAVVGGIVAAAGGAFSPSTGGGTAVKPSPTTGSVLGDDQAQSESIDKTYQLLKDIHAQEYAELRGINTGIGSLKDAITGTITKIFQNGGIKDADVGGLGSKSNIPSLDPISRFITDMLFGKTKTEITGGGIQTGAVSIADIMAGGSATGSAYTTVQKTKSGGLFGSLFGGKKTSTSTVFSGLETGLTDSLTDIFQSAGQVMTGLADSLGEGLNLRVRDYIIPSLTVELRGLSGEEAAKKLNGVISTALDNMAASVFGDIIGQYQQLGEGMLETAVRIVAEVAVVRDALEASGLGLGANAIAISDALAQAAGGLQEFQKQFEAYYDKFYSESEKQSRLQDKLTSQLGDLNLILPQTREGYRKLIESLDISNQSDQERYSLLLSLAGAADQYYTAITEGAAKASNLAQQQRALDIALMEAQGDALGALAEKRKDELAAMDESLRLTQKSIWAFQDLTKAQQEAAQAAAKAVTDAMAVLNKAVATEKKTITDRYNAAVKTSQDAIDAFSEAAQKALNALNQAVETERKTITDIYTAAVERSQAAIDKLSTSVSKLSSIADMLRNASDDTAIAGNESAERRRAQQQLLDAIKTGALDEDILSQALDVVARPSENLFTTFTDYQRDFVKTSNNINDLSTIADNQLGKAQTQLDIEKAQLEALQTGYEKEIARLDAIVQLAQTQIDAANGTTGAVMSVRQAQDAIAAATGKLGGVTVTTMREQIAQAKAVYDGEIARLDSILASAQAQIDAANGTTIATRSVQMAVLDVKLAIDGQKVQAARAAADLQQLMTATAAAAEADRQARARAAAEAKAAADKAAAEAKAAAAARAAAEAAAAAERAKAEAAARAATLAGYRANTPTTYINGQTNNPYWEKILSDFNMRHTSQFGIAMNRNWNADADAQAQYQVLRSQYLASIPAFASGGMHTGGLAIVGEHGPELVNMPAGRVFNHNESKAMMNNDDLILEIRALRAEVSMLRASSDSTAQSTRKTSDLLRNVTQDGNSLLTTAA